MSRKASSALKVARRPKRAIQLSAAGTRSSKAPLTVGRPELLVDGSDRHFRRLVHALFPFLTVHSEIRNGYAELLGLTGPAYSIMLCIRVLGDSGPVNIRTIADQLRASGSFITAETNVLERKGFVKKKRGLADKRLVSVTLTPRAIELLDSIAPLRQRVNDVQFGCLTHNEFRLLVPLIEKLMQSGERALAVLNFLRQHNSGQWADLFDAAESEAAMRVSRRVAG
jgi:MarR family transcriptional regulator, organic hydroperoxide resistance regulator